MIGEAQLRADWQAVADYIEGQAKTAAASAAIAETVQETQETVQEAVDNVIPFPTGARA